MPRLTERQQLALVRRVIREWRERGGGRPITINTLADHTGLSPRRCDTLARQYDLDVRQNARQTQEGISDEYCVALEKMREWCEARAANFRRTVIRAIDLFTRRRE